MRTDNKYEEANVLYINDFLINSDQRNIDRYKRYENKYNKYGIFELSEGVVLRHYTHVRIDELMSNFEKIIFKPVIYTTMNGHKSNGLYYIGRKINQIKSNQHINQLTHEAKKLGASASTMISSKGIQVKDDLAALCNGEYICPSYGLSANCPPYVKGPDEFRKWQAQSKYSITVKIELPTSVMFSDERKGVMQLLHQIVAKIEQKAVEIGFKKSKAFAGGSCKELFCGDQEKCCVLAEKKSCRHIKVARPSMSGFGIDVTQLMKSSGWSAIKSVNMNGKDKISWVAGLILLV